MNPKNTRKIFVRAIYIMVILVVTLSVTAMASAAAPSPFLGKWEAIDPGDKSDIRLAIAGRPSGPFRITWTESSFGGCGGEAGIVRGTGRISESDPNILEADLTFECFTIDRLIDFHITWRYHPATNTLSSRDEIGLVTIWHRPGQPQASPPALNLRVMYGDDWVESFYEAGHTIWITVTESDRFTPKATAEVVTAPRDEWGGESGFQTRPEDWIPAQPDIQPNDWVYGWVDNGASAQVQIGDISGTIDLASDSISGTINAPWFLDQQVEVECHSWGAPLPEEILKYDMALPNNEDKYSCSWAGEWDIQPGQNVGVAYTGPDGQWVANAFSVPESFQIIAHSDEDWVEGMGFQDGTVVNLLIVDTNGVQVYVNSTVATYPDWEPDIVHAIFEVGYDLKAGDRLWMTDGVLVKELVVTTLEITDIDLNTHTVSGSAEPGSDVIIEYPPDLYFSVTSDLQGNWVANLEGLTAGIAGLASQEDEDGDLTRVTIFFP